MSTGDWTYSVLHKWWSLLDHPEIGHILEEDMPEELKP